MRDIDRLHEENDYKVEVLGFISSIKVKIERFYKLQQEEKK